MKTYRLQLPALPRYVVFREGELAIKARNSAPRNKVLRWSAGGPVRPEGGDPMSNISVSHVYAIAPATLWALVGAPEKLANWHPAIAQSPVAGDQRTCILADGATVKEQITNHSDEDRRYSYRITESPLPMRDYVSTISVQSEGNGARLTWESQFEAVGAPAAEVEAMLRGLYEAGLQSVGAHFA
jgi:hypothetical protein